MKATESPEIEVAFERLAYGIIEQAVNDVKYLTKVGMIRQGQPVTRWPTTRKGAPKTLDNEFRGVSQVRALLHFLRDDGHAQILLEWLGSDITPGTIRSRLGLG